MGDKTIKDSFKIEAGSGKEAYLILDRLFTDNENRKSFMDLENRYQTLLVRTWLPSTEPEEFSAIINEMGQIRRQQISMTSDCITNPKTGQRAKALGLPLKLDSS